MCNDKVQLSSQVWGIIDMLASRPQPPAEGASRASLGSLAEYPSIQFGKLVKYPSYLHRPDLHYDDVLSAYEAIKKDLPNLERNSNLPIEGPTGIFHLSSADMRRARDYQAAYSIALVTALVFSQILYAHGPEPTNWQLDSEVFVQKLISVSEDASRFRPVGAGFMAGNLCAAWAATENEAQKEHIAEMMKDLSESFRGEDLSKMSTWWYYKFMALRCSKGRTKPGDDESKALEETAKIVSCVQCSASHNYIELLPH